MTDTTATTTRTRVRKSACGMVRSLLETSPEMSDSDIFAAMTEAFPGKTYTVALVSRYRRELYPTTTVETVTPSTTEDVRAATVTRLAKELMEAAD